VHTELVGELQVSEDTQNGTAVQSGHVSAMPSFR
jgi:hypothetical protein